MATPANQAGQRQDAAVSTLNPLDFYDVRSELSEDEQMVQDSVELGRRPFALVIIFQCQL